MRDHILAEIRRLTVENDGAPIGQRTFENETGIKQSQWRGKLWARWGDAVAEAGHRRNTATPKLNPDTVLDHLEEACRDYRHFPTYAEWRMYTQEKPIGINSYHRAFGGREEAITALRDRAIERGENDLLEILPDTETNAAETEDVPATGSFERLQNDHRFVYLIKSGNQKLYKIGQAKNVEGRIENLRTADPSIEPIHKIRTRDPGAIEKYWHDLFCACREIQRCEKNETRIFRRGTAGSRAARRPRCPVLASSSSMLG